MAFKRGNLLSAQFVKEGSVGEETILILRISQRFQKLSAIFLGDLVTHERQEGLKLSQHHGSIFIFVVQFAQLNKVMIVSSVFWLSKTFLTSSTTSSNGRNFFSTSSVWPYLTQTFLVRFMPLA